LQDLNRKLLVQNIKISIPESYFRIILSGCDVLFEFTGKIYIIPDYAIALEFRLLVLVCEIRPMAPIFLKVK